VFVVQHSPVNGSHVPTLTDPHWDSDLISYVPSGEDYESAVTVIMTLGRRLEGSSSTWTHES
jgi:hypothetical protein